MKSLFVSVNSEGDGTAEALALAEALGRESGLEGKNLIRLRLLTEELLGMLRGIAGRVEANFWLEAEGRNFEIHMKSEVGITPEMREQFLSASSSGKNDAARGLMGKIRVMIASALLSMKETMPYAMMNYAASYPTGGEYSAVWSMSSYRDEVSHGLDHTEEATAAWDELEKSIVANIADDVRVRIVGKTVEIIVLKAFA